MNMTEGVKHVRSIIQCSIIPVLVILMSLFLTTCISDNKKQEQGFDDIANKIILDWYNLYLQTERVDKNAVPPFAARNLVQISLGVYTVVEEHKHLFETKDPQALRLLNHAFYLSMSAIYDKKTIGSAASWLNALYQSTNRNLHTKAFYSDLYIRHILEENERRFREDTLDTDSISYLPAYTPDPRFIYSNHIGMLPDWGNNKTILVRKSDIHLDSPYKRSLDFEKALYDDALSVYMQSKQLTYEDKWIGDFWSDEIRGLTFSPIGRWVSITNQTLAVEFLPALTVIRMYRDLGIALYDASVISWNIKYHYNLIRPEQYIRTFIDSTWHAKHHPDYPSYPSAHSVFSGASGTILEHYFKNKNRLTDDSHKQRIEFYSEKRTYKNFRSMYKECAYSRFLVGVHYLSDCEAGLNVGISVAKNVLQNAE